MQTTEVRNGLKRFLKAHKDILFFLFLVCLLALILILVSIANYYLLLKNNHKKTWQKRNVSIPSKIRTTSNSNFTEIATTASNFTFGEQNSI